MVITPALDLIINLADKSSAGRLALLGSRVVALPGSAAQSSKAIRTAEAYARVRACLPSNRADRAFDDVDLTSAVVRLSIGVPDEVPASGAFPLAPVAPQTAGPLIAGKRYLIANFVAGDSFLNVGASANSTGTVFIASGPAPSQWTHGSALQEITADLSVTASYLEVQAALNATAPIAALGGVTVIALGKGAYKVTFAAFGPQPAIAGPINANMTPLSVVSVARVQVGTDRLHEVQIIRLLALPYAFSTLATPFPGPAGTIDEIQTATEKRPATKRHTLDPAPYAGTFPITINGKEKRVPYDVEPDELHALAGPEVLVSKRAANIWEFTHADPAGAIELEAGTDGLLVPAGVTGPISLNTPGIFEAFAATAAKWIKLTLEVKIQFPGKAPQAFYQGTIELYRDLLNEGSMVPPTLAGLQFVASNLAATPFTYTNAITALRGGLFSLEAVDTTPLALDTLYLFPVNGIVQSFLVKAGPADPDDPTGQVAPLNHDAILNDKHWERSGL